ncbi:MAG TPA: zinc-ribbon domain-containing protein [Pyrinomonadaceae bacterium]|nr:zinc-ribbon domain-containing protein [Pyrinomonadaceae bacterium]
MICSNCGTEIPLNERFCRNCGHEAVPLAATINVGPPTLRDIPASHRSAAAETAQMWAAPSTGPISAPFNAPASPRRSSLVIPVLAGLVILLTIAGGLAYFLFLRDKDGGVTANREGMPPGTGSGTNGQLPDHFGIFLRDGDTLTELRRMDFSDAIKGRDAMLGDATLPRADAMPSIILYAESQDIPTSELKLVQLDGIDPSGSVRHWNFQVSPVEGGRRGMKQIKVPGGLASGKYALALFKDFLNEGNHKFWPFQVSAGAPTPSTSPQVAKMQVKPGATTTTPTATPEARTPLAPPPTTTANTAAGGRLAYCNDDNVVLRATPSLTGAKLNKLMRGQRLWAVGKSDNKSSWGGITSDWTRVQLYDRSQTGWVFSPFISY